MVAEFIARQSGSPINGETACLNNSTMPSSMAHSGHAGHDIHVPHPVLSHSMHLQQQQPQQHQQQSQQQQQQQQPTLLQQQQQMEEGDAYGSNYDLRKELFSQRKQREFIPDNKKDDSYWDRRRRNNEAAKRSREKRRFNDMVLEQRVMELSKENHVLKSQLEAIRDKFGICGEQLISAEHILAALPSEATLAKRTKLSGSNSLLYTRTPSPVHTSVIHQPVQGNGTRSPRCSRSPAQIFSSSTNDNSNFNSETDGFQYPFAHHHHHHHQLASGLAHLSSHHQFNQQGQQHQPLQAQSQPAPQQPSPPPHHRQNSSPPTPTFETNSALNLSSRSRREPSPFDVSSGSGDECSQLQSQQGAGGPNNCLPHKLRHKSRIGDKDAASALLALQGIKQEPPSRASPPWDNEGSSDERDSGISLGSEWTGSNNKTNTPLPESEREVKSRLDRLASEVASLQSILRLSKQQQPQQQNEAVSTP